MVQSRSGLLTWWTNRLRGGSFIGSWTHGGLIYFLVAPALFVLHCKCFPLFSPAWRGTRRRCLLECGVEICLSLVGAWGGVEVSLEMNFEPCEECVRSEKLWKWLEGKMSPEMNLQV